MTVLPPAVEEGAMSLSEHERRSLEETARQLRAEDPDLAERLESFEAEVPDTPTESGLGSWRPWSVCTLLAAVTTGLRILLLVLTPSAPQQPPSRSGEETSESTEQVPEGEHLDEQVPVGPVR